MSERNVPFAAISEVAGNRVLQLLVARHGRFREEALDSDEVEEEEHEGAEEQDHVRRLIKSLVRIREDGTASGGDGYIGINIGILYQRRLVS